MLNRKVQRGVERLIRGWLLELRRHPRTTHLDPEYGRRYFWNERDYQWSLLSHMKRHAWTVGLGSKWSVHAEGTWDRPRYARKAKWKVQKRSDIVVVNHAALLRWVRNDFPGVRHTFRMEAAIELKKTYGHSTAVRRLVQADVRKLDWIVRNDDAKVGYLVWLDDLRTNRDGSGSPFFSPEEIMEMRRGTRVRVFHWPDSQFRVVTRDEVTAVRKEIRAARIGLYPTR